MSTSDSCDVNGHTARCTSPVSVIWQCKLVSGWGLRKRRSGPPYGSGRTFNVSTVLCLSSSAILSINAGSYRSCPCSSATFSADCQSSLVPLDRRSCSQILSSRSSSSRFDVLTKSNKKLNKFQTRSLLAHWNWTSVSLLLLLFLAYNYMRFTYLFHLIDCLNHPYFRNYWTVR